MVLTSLPEAISGVGFARLRAQVGASVGQLQAYEPTGQVAAAAAEQVAAEMPPPSAAELQRAAQVVLSQKAARQAPLEALLARQLIAIFDRSKPRGEPSGLLRQGTAWRSP